MCCGCRRCVGYRLLNGFRQVCCLHHDSFCYRLSGSDGYHCRNGDSRDHGGVGDVEGGVEDSILDNIRGSILGNSQDNMDKDDTKDRTNPM